MADKICTRFIDDDGLDIGCHLVSKEYALEAYPDLVPWMKAPALWMWGSGFNGKLGNDSIINQSSPVQTVSGGTNWKSTSGSSLHFAAIKTDGSLWLWGNGLYGVLGNSSNIPRSSPVQTISGGTNWKSVSINCLHSAAIKTDGSLWLWGSSSNGRLGTNNITVHRSSPVQTFSGGTNWKSVSLGAQHGSAIKTDGSLWLWGNNVSGTIGDNSVIAKSSPVQTISAGTNWRSVSAGYTHSAAIKTDGSLWLWGCALVGRLGDDSFINKSSPVQTVSGGTNWKSVSINCLHSAAIKTDGSLWLWGAASAGQLGNNSAAGGNKSSPIQTISGGTNWKSVSTGCAHSAAIKTDGSLWLWGQRDIIGDNLLIDRSSPVQTVSGGTDWKNISLGHTNSAAIRDEGDF